MNVFLCHPRRSAIGRLSSTLAGVRPDDLAAHILRAVLQEAPELDWVAIDEVMMGSVNQTGEDNRNVARMSALLAVLPISVPGTTLNWLCGSGMDAVGTAFRAVRARELDLVLAGGVESMYRAPYVLGKADSGFSRDQKIEDPNIGWRFVNPQMKEQYGIDSMPETAESVAEQFNISREDQNLFTFRSQQKATREQQQGVFAQEIVPGSIPRRKQDPLVFDTDEYPRSTMLEKLASLSTPFRENGCVTAGKASGVNDDAAAMLVVSKAAVKQTQTRAHGEDPRHGSRWCGSSHYGYWACACSTKTDGETEYHHRRHRRDRAKRSLCRSRPGDFA
tara:strand:+ start:279 stop:1280 length:1002 start_codon:yes stop_codon:yes gene_type:complete